MTDQSTHSSLLTRNLCALFATRPEVEAIALGGSRSADVSDALSDIDLYVYTTGEVPLSERQAIVARAGGATRANLGMSFWGAGDEWYDAATGIHIDSIYFEAAWMECQVRRVLDEHQASLGYSTCFWRTTRQSECLYDRQGWFQKLQQLAQADYPEALRRNIIQLNHPVLRNAIPAYLHQLEKAVLRQDRVSINHRVAGLLASYFDVLFALNRVPHPGEKRLIAYASRECATLPVAMATDLEAILYNAATDDHLLVTVVNRLLERLDDLLEQEGFDTRLWM